MLGSCWYFPIWLLGACVPLCPRLLPAGPRTTVARNLLAVATVVALTAFRHTAQFAAWTGSMTLEAGDFLVGIAFAVALYVLVQDRRPDTSSRYRVLATRTAAFSYTLYVVHMPMLMFLRAALNDGPQWSAGVGTTAAAMLIFVVLVGYAWVIWYCCESRTAIVRAWVSRLGARGVVTLERSASRS
ncbi:MAG: acyltransferase family protein [Vicinamibacterales bacterium]